MFNDQAQRGEGAQNANVPFVLTDISPEIFTAMMEFIYTNCVTLTPKIVRIALIPDTESQVINVTQCAASNRVV
jgi:hypothetical protein